jgi:hypothetical protein
MQTPFRRLITSADTIHATYYLGQERQVPVLQVHNVSEQRKCAVLVPHIPVERLDGLVLDELANMVFALQRSQLMLAEARKGIRVRAAADR